MKRWLFLLTVAAVVLFVFGGCVLDGDDDDDDNADKAASFADISMGGGVFLFPSKGVGMAQIGTFHDGEVFDDARVYIDGIPLGANLGFHSNDTLLPYDEIAADGVVRIAVHAFGDSVVHELNVPEEPVISVPAEGARAVVGQPVDVEIGFPGAHRYISVTLIDQDGFAFGLETDRTKLAMTIPAEKIIETGIFPMNAYSITTSGEIPDSFDFESQYDVFLVASVATREVQFVEAQ